MASLSISQAALIKNLQKHIENIRMSLFNLIKKHNRVWATTNGFGQLTAFVIANVSWGGAHKLGYCMALHELAHVECYKRIFAAEKKLRQ